MADKYGIDSLISYFSFIEKEKISIGNSLISWELAKALAKTGENTRALELSSKIGKAFPSFEQAHLLCLALSSLTGDGAGYAYYSERFQTAAEMMYSISDTAGFKKTLQAKTASKKSSAETLKKYFSTGDDEAEASYLFDFILIFNNEALKLLPKEEALKLLRNDRGNPALLERLGDLYFGEREYPSALTLYRKALAKKPSIGLYRKICATYSMLEDYKKAQAAADDLTSAYTGPEALVYAAEVYYSSGSPEKAVKALEAAAAKSKGAEPDIKYRISMNLAKVYFSTGGNATSMKWILNALKIKKDDEDALMLLFQVYFQMKEYENALKVIRKLETAGDLDFLKKITIENIRSQTESMLQSQPDENFDGKNMYTRKEDGGTEFLFYYKDSRGVAREYNALDRVLSGGYVDFGMIVANAGKEKDVEKYLIGRLKTARLLPDETEDAYKKLLGIYLAKLNYFRNTKKNDAEFLSWADRIYKITGKTKTSDMLATFYSTMADHYYALDRYGDCVEQLKAKLDFWRGMKKTDQIIYTMLDIANTYYTSGDTANALEWADTCISFSGKLLHPKLYHAYYIKGIIHYGLENMDEAYMNFMKVLDPSTAKAVVLQDMEHYRDLLTKTNYYTGNIYYWLGKYKKALSHYIDSYSHSKNDDLFFSFFYGGIGRILLSLGDNDNALAFYTEALKHIPEMRPDLRGNTLLEQAYALSRLNRFDEAVRCMDEAEGAYGRSGDPAGISSTYLGNAEMALADINDISAAEGYLAKYLSGSEKAGQKPSWKYFLQSGLLAEKKKDSKTALANFGAAVKALEADNSLVKSRYLKEELTAKMYNLYQKVFDLYLDGGDTPAAYGIAQRIKSINFTANFRSRRVFASSGYGDIPGLLGPKEALIDYFCTDDGLYIFLFTARGVTVKAGMTKYPDLEELVKKTRRDILDPYNYIFESSDESKYAPGLRSLYDLLIKPLEADLSGISRLTIVPHRILHYIPFAALMPGNGKSRFLAESHEISYLTNSSLAGFYSLKTYGETGVFYVFSNPGTEAYDKIDLFDTQSRLLKKMYPAARIYSDTQATESEAKKACLEKGVVHFATHGRLIVEEPENSYLYLYRDGAEDGFLTAREIEALGCSSKLVTLNGCQTGVGFMRGISESFSDGRGIIPGADNIISIERSFLLSGARAVISNFWSVLDYPAIELMNRFYGFLPEKGTAGALTAAQREMLNSGGKEYFLYRIDLGHPFFWASYKISGER